MGEDRNPAELGHMIQSLTQDYIQKIQVTATGGVGLFRTLWLIAEKANVRELALLLGVAENQPVRIESLARILDSLVSRSTIYRKIPELVEAGLLVVREDGGICVADPLETLRLVAQLNRLTREVIKSEDNT
jgi:DNA-binding transcriptional ArsR family regulator